MTCTAARMIHLELVRDLSTTSLVWCLKRFVWRRGLPKLMLSDNGETLKADQLKAFNTRNGIIWRFNLAKAPWWGGLFEWLIRSTKRCLRMCEKLHTYLWRVLHSIGTDWRSIEQPTTNLPWWKRYRRATYTNPSYCGHRILNPIEGEGYESDPHFKNNREQALSRKHQLEQVLQFFWKRWRKDYLLELRSTHVGNKTKESNIKVNDIVTVLDEN